MTSRLAWLDDAPAMRRLRLSVAWGPTDRRGSPAAGALDIDWGGLLDGLSRAEPDRLRPYDAYVDDGRWERDNPLWGLRRTRSTLPSIRPFDLRPTRTYIGICSVTMAFLYNRKEEGWPSRQRGGIGAEQRFANLFASELHRGHPSIFDFALRLEGPAAILYSSVRDVPRLFPRMATYWRRRVPLLS